MNKMKKMSFFEIYFIGFFFHFTNSKTELDRVESCCKTYTINFHCIENKETNKR